MFYPCEIKDQPAQPTLVVKTVLPAAELPGAIGAAYGAVLAHLNALGETPAGPPFVAYFNMDMQNLEVEMGFPVAKPLAGTERLQAGQLPTGKIVTCLYVGPYEEMVPAYSALEAYAKENGYEPTGVAYETYLNGPADVTSPQEYQTQIMFPLKK